MPIQGYIGYEEGGSTLHSNIVAYHIRYRLSLLFDISQYILCLLTVSVGFQRCTLHVHRTAYEFQLGQQYFGVRCKLDVQLYILLAHMMRYVFDYVYFTTSSCTALTEAVRRRPYQVILLDEFEKAHKEVGW
jgi:hypothetical protein